MAAERQANKKNPWLGEHVHRYQEAMNLLAPNFTILDIACGSGYGSNLLASYEKCEVIGMDISEEAISLCKQSNSLPNISFQQADGTSIPIENDHFDMVISFETIEHTTEYRKLIQEFKRVLKKSGVLILSTPNYIINSPDGEIKNPFHTQEFTYNQLQEILQTEFRTVKIYGQKYIRYENARGLKKLGKIVEKMLYMRGLRKIPLPVQDWIISIFTGTEQYPTPNDFKMVEDKNEVVACKTFFAVCRS